MASGMEKEDVEAEVAKIHGDTMLKIHYQVENEPLKRMKSHLRDSKRLDPRPLENCNSFQDLTKLLCGKELIEHGQYDLLKEVFKGIGMDILIKDLNEAEEEIASINQAGGKKKREMKAGIENIHADTMLKIHDQLVNEEMNTIKAYLQDSRRLEPRPLENCNGFQDLANLLLKKELIKHGEYKVLKDLFKSITMNVLIDDLTKAEEEIARIKLGGED